MGTLDELIFYCKMKKPGGAMVLLGESGCGKTHLVERDLQEALRDTHVIVRVSLYGISSIDALHEAVKKQWFISLLPIRSKKIKPEQLVVGKSFMNAINSVLSILNPRAGSIGLAASVFINDIVVLSVVEDIHTKQMKRVVLVFDDVDHALLNPTELLGTINDYCENRHFNTIMIAEMESFVEMDPQTEHVIKLAKEKTVAYTVFDFPDYGKIIHNLIADREWKNEEYAKFLQQHEQTIIQLFVSDSKETIDISAPLDKCHNLRSLVTGLESFFRIYHHMTEAGIPDIEPYLCAFLPYYLAEKSGVMRNGKTSFTYTDEELCSLYPSFSAGNLFDSVRQWIRQGYWDPELFTKELSRVRTADREKA